MPRISRRKSNVALQLLAISAIIFCAIDCHGQELQRLNSNGKTTGESEQAFGKTLETVDAQPDENSMEAEGPDVELDDGQEEQRPISFEPVYTGEVFTNARGGISTRGATQYQGLLDLVMAVDMDQTRIPLPGNFTMLVQNTHGRGLTEDFIGDTQTISNIDSGDNIMQVSEYWWEFDCLDDRLTVRLGKQDLNTSFLVMDLAGDFIQSSFGLSPSAGFPSYPNPSMAAVVLAQITSSTQWKFGVWDAYANGGSWGFSDNDLTYFFTEMESKYALKEGRLPGALDIGYGYVSGGELAGSILPSGYGFYFQWEQLVYRENPWEEDDSQGLGFFVSYFPKFSNGDIPISAIDDDFVAGLVYQGLIAGRDEDVIGTGVAWAQLNQGGTNQETVTEVFYKAQVTRAVSIQPDIQYIASPSGIHRDSLAVGIRFQWIPPSALSKTFDFSQPEVPR